MNDDDNLESLLRQSIEIVNARNWRGKIKMTERCVAVENSDEVYHKSCFEVEYPNDEKQPEHNDYVPQEDDECDFCAGLLIEPPDEDDDDFEPEEDD